MAGLKKTFKYIKKMVVTSRKGNKYTRYFYKRGKQTVARSKQTVLKPKAISDVNKLKGNLTKLDGKILKQYITERRANGIDVLDFVGGKYPFSSKEWFRLVAGKKYRSIAKKRDPLSKKKILDAAKKILSKTYK